MRSLRRSRSTRHPSRASPRSGHNAPARSRSRRRRTETGAGLRTDRGGVKLWVSNSGRQGVRDARDRPRQTTRSRHGNPADPARPGQQTEPMPRVVAFFYNSAQGNLAIQLLTALGIPNDRLGRHPARADRGGQGMVLSIACPDETLAARVESICRAAGRRDPPPAPLDHRRESAPRRPIAMHRPTDAPHLRGPSTMRLRVLPALLILGAASRPPDHRRRRADVPSFAKDVPDVTIGRADPPVQRQGPDRVLHLHAGPSYDDPDRVFTVSDGMIHISGEEFGGLTTLRRTSATIT